MRSKVSWSGQRCIAVFLGIAGLVAAAWFLPAFPGRAVTRLEIPESDLLDGDAAPIRVFRTADDLRQALPAKSTQPLPEVNWDSTDVVRVRGRAVGYINPASKHVQFGTLVCSARLAGTRLFLYLHETTPDVLGGEVSSVSMQVYREAWFAVPQDARLEYGQRGMVFLDLVIGGLSLLLSIACIVVLVRLRRRPRNQSVAPDHERPRLAQLLPV